MPQIKTFMDFICPFSYIVFSILNKLRKEENDVEHIWYPYILNENTPIEGSDISKTFDAQKRKTVLKRLNSLGSEYDLEFNNGSLIFNTNRAHEAALYAQDQGKFYEFAKEVFDSVFKRDENIGKKEVLDKIALNLGIDVEGMNKAIDKKVYKECLGKAKQVARDFEVNSVPTFIVDDVKKVTDLKDYESFKADLMK